jgi:hypothetical protein
MALMPHAQDTTEEILAPHMEALGGLFPAAWERWERFGEEMPDLRVVCCKRTRASMISNFAVTEARTAFASQSPSILLHDLRKFLLIEFDSQLCLRLKKFRAGGRQTSGIHTRQKRAFEAQEPLTGMPETTNLVLGYDLNAEETDIAAAAITCRTNGKLHWEIEVPLPGEIVPIEASTPRPDIPSPQITSTRTARADQRTESGA